MYSILCKKKMKNSYVYSAREKISQLYLYALCLFQQRP